MSTVRMCDNPRCETIFSERSEGWSATTQVQNYWDKEKEERRSRVVSLDLCAACSNLFAGAPALESAPTVPMNEEERRDSRRR